MRGVEAEDPDRHLAGLDYRLKGEARLKEKVARTVEEQPGLTAARALSGIPDAVRFTFIVPITEEEAMRIVDRIRREAAASG